MLVNPNDISLWRFQIGQCNNFCGTVLAPIAQTSSQGVGCWCYQYGPEFPVPQNRRKRMRVNSRGHFLSGMLTKEPKKETNHWKGSVPLTSSHVVLLNRNVVGVFAQDDPCSCAQCIGERRNEGRVSCVGGLFGLGGLGLAKCLLYVR